MKIRFGHFLIRVGHWLIGSVEVVRDVAKAAAHARSHPTDLQDR